MSNYNHELIAPFDVDDESLDNIAPAVVFAMGVEWCLWYCRINDGSVRTDFCMEANAMRLQRLLERWGWQCEAQPTNYPGWSMMWVGRK